MIAALVLPAGRCFGQATNPVAPATQNAIQRYVDNASVLIAAPARQPNAPGDPSQNAVDLAAPPPPAKKEATTQPTTQPTKAGGEWLLVPLPTHKPEFGWGVNAIAGYIFPLDPADKISPPSTIAAIGYYSQNSSWAGGLASKFYLDEDRYRISAAAFHGQINYDFFGIGNDAGNAGRSIPLHETMTGGTAEALIRIAPDLYLGPHYTGAGIGISADTGELNPPVTIPARELHTTSSGLGLHLQWDTRDSQFYPHDGGLLDVDASFHDPVLGDNFAYQVFDISYDRYFSLSDRQVLACRLKGQFENGNVPFYALSTFGRGADLRGYQPGQYQDKQLLAGQVEYRLEITRRIGAVAFGGFTTGTSTRTTCAECLAAFGVCSS